jgi:hypothetical protein
MSTNKKQQWESYCKKQLEVITPLLLEEGFVLEEDQPHTYGERYLLSGNKLVLYGMRTIDEQRVVIKITNDAKLAEELEKERTCSEALHAMHFAYETFYSPEEILFGRHEAYTFYITKYIPQEKKFLEYSLEKQFFFALKAFEAQEGSHAVARSHMQTIKKTFDIFTADTYVQTLTRYKNEVCASRVNSKSTAQLNLAMDTLTSEKELLERYTNFLTHWDFVPHNIRIHNDLMYLLDHTAIRFGNKYEGWARFMNFMMLYHPELELALDQYVQENRLTDEHTSLQLMRIYRLSELVWFYTKKREKAEGNLEILTDARIAFWTSALEAQLQNKPLEKEVIERYKKTRDSLRDTDEVQRQKNLH